MHIPTFSGLLETVDTKVVAIFLPNNFIFEHGTCARW